MFSKIGHLTKLQHYYQQASDGAVTVTALNGAAIQNSHEYT